MSEKIPIEERSVQKENSRESPLSILATHVRKVSKAGERTISKGLEKTETDCHTVGEHCLFPKTTVKNLLKGASVRVLRSVLLSSAENGPWNKRSSGFHPTQRGARYERSKLLSNDLAMFWNQTSEYG